jgi:hypothetical protein
MKGTIVTEPVTSGAAGIAAWKVGGAILGIGVVASGLGFLVLWPRTAREALVRVMATMAGSALLGPLVVIAFYLKWPELFAAAARLAGSWGLDPVAGQLAISAPLIALGGLPFWWILGALLLWFDKRRGKDLGELAADARADVRNILPAP